LSVIRSADKGAGLLTDTASCSGQREGPFSGAVNRLVLPGQLSHYRNWVADWTSWQTGFDSTQG